VTAVPGTDLTRFVKSSWAIVGTLLATSLVSLAAWGRGLGDWSLLARVQIAGTFAALAALFTLRFGARWFRPALCLYATAMTCECLSVSTGFPFGRDVFSAFLGPKAFGLAPYLIGLAWLNAALPAAAIAAAAFPASGDRARRVALGAIVMLSWDWTIEPLMGRTLGAWRWLEGGAYFGTPLVNFAGWLAVASALLALLELSLFRLDFDASRDRPLFALFAVNCLGAIGGAAISGLWSALAMTAANAAAAFALARTRRAAAVLATASLLLLRSPVAAKTSPADAAYRAEHFDEAFKLYLPRAENGDPEAQYRVGFLYMKGWGVSGDLKQAESWFRKAADAGDSYGEYQVGMFLQLGVLAPADKGAGAAWIGKAAAHGNPFAQNQYGTFFATGTGVEKSLAAAVAWYRKAAKKGLDAAEYNLARSLEEGWLAKPDAKAAAKLYEAAARQGFPPAQKALCALAKKCAPFTPKPRLRLADFARYP